MWAEKSRRTGCRKGRRSWRWLSSDGFTRGLPFYWRCWRDGWLVHPRREERPRIERSGEREAEEAGAAVAEFDFGGDEAVGVGAAALAFGDGFGLEGFEGFDLEEGAAD